MPRIYHTTNSATNTANAPLISITGSAAVRPSIREVILGSRATPADQAAAYQLQNVTTAGDRTALTAAARDSGDPAALSVPRGQAGGTLDPAFGTNIFLLISLNQRATFRWIAAPDGEILLPVGTANGAGLRAVAVSLAFTCDATLAWAE